MFNGQRAGLSQARDAGPELQEQRGDPGDLRQVPDIQAGRLRQVRKHNHSPPPPPSPEVLWRRSIFDTAPAFANSNMFISTPALAPAQYSSICSERNFFL